MDTGPTEERSDLGRLSSIDVEKLAKLLGASVLTLYVIGLIAVNGYLFQLDVTDFGLVRARFVYTGALLATSGVLPYVLLRSLVTYDELQQQSGPLGAAAMFKSLPRRTKLALIGLLLVIPTAIVVILIIVNNYGLPRGLLEAAIVVLPVYILGLILCKVVERIFRKALHKIGNAGMDRLLLRDASAHHLLRDSVLVLAAFKVLLFPVIYITVFMALSYPEIPEQFGGGRPSFVRLLIKKEAISGAAELGIRMSRPGSGLTCKLALIYEGSDGYVLEPTLKRIVHLNKDMVSGVITKQSAPETLTC